MPVQSCRVGRRKGRKFGTRGKCFTGRNAQARAERQGQAIKASQARRGTMENFRCGCVRNAERGQSVPSNPLKADPSRSITLRRMFVTEFSKRFLKLKSLIIRLVDLQDAFGLRTQNKEQDDGRSSQSTISPVGNNDREVTGAGGQTVKNDGLSIENLGKTDVTLNQNEERNNAERIIGIVQSSKHSGKEGNATVQTSGRSFRKDRADRGETRHSLGTNPREILPTLNAPFRFRTTQGQVRAFERWLQLQINKEILGGGGSAVNAPIIAHDAYWEKFVRRGYEKGAGRAFSDVRFAERAAQGEDVEEFFSGTREEFLRSSFARPESIVKVKLLASRVFTDLKNVTDDMATKMSRVLTDGLVRGQNPRVIARELNRQIDGLGTRTMTARRRAEVLARTEILRAHAEGQLDAFENLGVEKVGVMAEWSTAGDDRVCPLCQPLEGSVMTIQEARGSLPLHAQCRCIWIPAQVGEDPNKKRKVRFTEPRTKKVRSLQIGRKRTKEEIEGAIDKSLKAAIPKRSKRTIAQQKTLSPFANKTIAKKRPKSVLEPLEKPKPKPTKRVTRKPPTVVPRTIPLPKASQEAIEQGKDFASTVKPLLRKLDQQGIDEILLTAEEVTADEVAGKAGFEVFAKDMGVSVSGTKKEMVKQFKDFFGRISVTKQQVDIIKSIKPLGVKPKIPPIRPATKELGKGNLLLGKDGKPVVMYRGTASKDLSAFGGPDTTNLVFLTPERKFAERYAAQFGKKGAVHKLQIKANNVIDISEGDGLKIWKRYKKETDAPSFASSQTTDGMAVSWQQEKPFRNWLQKEGIDYDGIYFAENDGSRSLAVRSIKQLDLLSSSK